MKFDAIVIGAGSAGYVAAIRLAQLKKSVLVIEKDKIGGTCLHYGCIPTKALISATEAMHAPKRFSRAGITVENISVDMGKLKSWKESVSAKLAKGIETLFKGNGVKFVMGDAFVRAPGEVVVDGEVYTAENIIVATGSEPLPIPGIEFDGENILTSKELLDLKLDPSSLNLAIVGGGVIGLEIGMTYARLGSNVTIVEMMDQVLPGIDKDIASLMLRFLKRMKIKVFTGTRVEAIDAGDGKVTLIARQGEKEVKVEADKVMVAIGRRPRSKGFGLEELGVKTDRRGFITTDDRFMTSVDRIYAIGDVASMPLLAHKAHKEGIMVAEIVAGVREKKDTPIIPAAIFTDPEIATAGLTESEAKEKGIDVRTGKFPFGANGRALSMGYLEGFTKIVAEAGSGRVLGVHIIGPDASNLIGEAVIAIQNGLTVEELGSTVHPHPTLSETLMEAAEAVDGKAIHILNR